MGHIGLATGNDITREYTQLDEHIASAGFNYERPIELGEYMPIIKAGAFGEYRSRAYLTRNFIYNWNFYSNTLPSGFQYMDLPSEVLVDSNYGEDKLYLLEEVKWRNNYRGKNILGAGYLSANIPLGRFSVYAGVRFEHNQMELISNTNDSHKSERSTYYTNNDLFPSINTTYRFNDKHQLRLSYGKSINRPEFREVSSSVYYDFDLASNVMGNTELQSCYIHNADFRYEWYPGRGEQVNIALFYKHFNNPIEWTYTVTGGTDLTYSYQNAKTADTYGVEVEIRKNLSFMCLPFLNFNFNGLLIKSKVHFEKESQEKDRAMQGQSPYLINTGLFYSNESQSFSMGLLYNRIGKRIVGVGRSVGTTGGDDTANIPNSYEMPRNAIDFTTSYKFAGHWEVKAGVRDLLAEKVRFMQSTDAFHKDGTTSTVEENTKLYYPGRNVNLSISYSF
jgi:Outer membrane receptor proteins, mostly Fe transport